MQRTTGGAILAMALLCGGLIVVTWRLSRPAVESHPSTSQSPGSTPAVSGNAASPTTQLATASAVASFPTRPGSYVDGVWRYDYSVSAPGTRSERRTGRLFENGREVTGALGDIRDTPLGRFAFFGLDARRYNFGWLNTMTYNQPVFAPDGKLLPAHQGYFSTPKDAESEAP